MSLWHHFSLDPTLWGPIGQFWMWVMVDSEIQNFNTLKINRFWFWIKIKPKKFASQVLSKHNFKIMVTHLLLNCPQIEELSRIRQSNIVSLSGLCFAFQTRIKCSSWVASYLCWWPVKQETLCSLPSTWRKIYSSIKWKMVSFPNAFWKS